VPGRNLVAYVDVDDTLVRSFGSKRIPMTEMVKHVRELHRDGIVLYAWSSGGADYARDSAKELGLEDCFAAFLPKPNIIIDDQAPAEWRRLIHVHPGEATAKTVREYAADVFGDDGTRG
jgi:hypothetical protein